ncbi:LPXTG cell wall anchor domain-containing protein, partial [uncultured Leifsonia sp.]|uniref:LPXTG cell wall anchor domain-containing protein n=1 Tax=uncultured Leifsonia sp. TaxID=340359 RepID=UPI0028D51C80
SVLGDSSSSGSSASAPAGTASGSGSTTSGDGGLLGGTQLPIHLGLPVTVGGNAISVVGDSETTGSTAPTTPTTPGTPGTPGGPGTPGTPGAPTGSTPAVPVDGGAAGVTVAAAGQVSALDGSARLASTGMDANTLGSVAGLLGLLGALALFGAGNRRRHHTR